MKQKIVLIASVVIGLLAALITRSYLNAKDREVENWKRQFDSSNRKIEVVVVKDDVPSGTVLQMSDLGGMNVIEKSVRGHVVKASDYLTLVGRKTVRALEKESPIFWSDIEGGQPGSG